MRELMIFVLAAALLAGCTGFATEGAKSVDVSDGPVSTGKTVEINMVAKNWEFQPATVTVHKGDTVKITLTSTDVAHGFSLPDFGVMERVEPGKPVVVTFVADKTGEFKFRCSVMCGSGHRGMTGMLVVEE